MNERTREKIDRAVGKICDAVEIAFLIALLPLLAFMIYVVWNTPVH